jgi:hypothetical protein
VVINDCDGFWAGLGPDEAQAELIVDADAVLAFPVSTQWFETVARRYPQIVEAGGDVQLEQLATRHPLEGLESLHRLTPGQ